MGNIWNNHFIGFMASLSFIGLVLSAVIGRDINAAFIVFNIWTATYYLKCEISGEE